MWIFTQTGFVSAVRHYSEPGTVVVRARDQESLAELAGFVDVQIAKSPLNDYPYRLHVSDESFVKWLTSNVASLNYTNFKDRVHDTRGDQYADALLSVWSIMHEVEDGDARSGR